MSSKLSRHREPRSPGWFDNDNENRGRGRRPRSTSRGHNGQPRESEKGRRHGGENELARSPSRRKKYTAQPVSVHRRRSRSVDSRHGGRTESSPHRSRRHRRSQSPRHSSQRHKRRHGSGSPTHKRRRSRSPGHGSGKHKKSRRPRSRSRSTASRNARRERSTSSRPRSPTSVKRHSHKSSTRPSRHDERLMSASPPPPPDMLSRRALLRTQEYRSRSPRRGNSPIHPQQHSIVRSPRREMSPPPSSKVRYISPLRRARTPPPPPPRLTKRDYPPIPRRRSSRSRSPPYHDQPLRRGRSPIPSHQPPPPIHGRSPVSSRGSFKRQPEFSPPHSRTKSPRRRSPLPPLSLKSSRQPFSDRPERGGRHMNEYEAVVQHSRNLSPDARDSPHRMSQTSDHGSMRSPSRELSSRRGRQFSPSPKYSDNPNIEDLNNPRYASRSEAKLENSPYPNSDRGRGRGAFDIGRGAPRGRGRGRGQDHHRNQPLNSVVNTYTPRRGGYRGRGESTPFSHQKQGHHDSPSPIQEHQNSHEVHTPQQPELPSESTDFERRLVAGFPPRGPRGAYRGRGVRGRGKGRIEVRESSLEPTPPTEAQPQITEQNQPELNHEIINGTMEERSSDEPSHKVPTDTEMLPPSRADVQQDEAQPAAGPFKRLTVESPIKPSPPTEPKGISFRPFTMNLPKTTPKVAKPGLIPKALDSHVGRKFATGSNSSPLGKPIDLSARLGRGKQPDLREMRDIRNTRDIRDMRDTRDTQNTRGIRDTREIRDKREVRDTRSFRDTRDTRVTRDTRDAGEIKDLRMPVKEPTYRSHQRQPSPSRPPSPPPPPARETIIKDMPIYQKVSMVGEGTYGKVYKASNNLTKELVALKRIRMESERDGFPITAVREMKLLQALKHENIVSLLEMMVDKSDFYMVFDYLDHDLTGILNHPTFRLELCHIKDLARQFFGALHYLHHRGVLHRDIKGSNILLSCDGQLKIADFGLARFYTKNSREMDYTNRIITLWYRPPEILLGATAYGPAVDMWSAACVFIELFTRSPAFPGRTEIDQLDTIYNVLGRPTEKLWPALKNMPWYLILQPKGPKPKNKFRKLYESKIPPSALDLILQLLQYDPDKRPTAEECLKHVYFSEEPAPQKPSGLKHITGDWHEYESKMERRKERDHQKKRHEAEKKKAKEDRDVERERKRVAGQQQYDPTRTIEADSSVGLPEDTAQLMQTG